MRSRHNMQRAPLLFCSPFLQGRATLNYCQAHPVCFSPSAMLFLFVCIAPHLRYSAWIAATGRVISLNRNGDTVSNGRCHCVPLFLPLPAMQRDDHIPSLSPSLPTTTTTCLFLLQCFCTSFFDLHDLRVFDVLAVTCRCISGGYLCRDCRVSLIYFSFFFPMQCYASRWHAVACVLSPSLC